MKYKVGDKVRIAKEGSHGFKIGEVVEITELFFEGIPPHYRADYLNDHWYVTDSEIEPITSKSLITKPIDFTGCHPEIAEALKQGLSVKCKVWDDVIGEKVDYVYAYDAGSIYPYRVENHYYRHVKPVTTQRVLRPIEETVQLLQQNGWGFNESNDLYNDDDTITISPSYLQSWEGKELDDDNLPDYLFKEIDE